MKIYQLENSNKIDSKIDPIKEKQKIEQNLKKLCKKSFFTNKKILSLGCGSGDWENLIFTESKCLYISGVDINYNCILNAKKHYPKIDFYNYDYNKLPKNFLANFNYLLWIPGSDSSYNFFNFIKNNFIDIIDYDISIILWPCTRNYGTFWIDEYSKIQELKKEDDVKFIDLLKLNKILPISTYCSNKEYFNFIKKLTQSLCKSKKLGNFIYLYKFNCPILYKHLNDQFYFLENNKNIYTNN